MVSTISLSPSQQAERAASIAKNGSAAPVKFYPLAVPGGEFTWAGHAAGYGYPRRLDVRGAILHTTESLSSIAGALSYDARRMDQVSATAFCGPNGELGMDVPEYCRPWTTGRWNDETVTLEVVGAAAWPASSWRARGPQMSGIVNWLVGACRRHSFPGVWLNAAEWAEGAGRQGVQPFRAGVRRGITDHWTANQAAISLGGSPSTYNHHDIGPGLREVVIDDLLPRVRNILSPTPPPTPPEIAAMFPMLYRLEGFRDVVHIFESGMVMPVSGEMLEAIRKQSDRPYEKGGNAQVNVWKFHLQTQLWLEHHLTYALTPD